MSKRAFTVTPEILSAFGLEGSACFSPVISGHINDTFRVASQQGSYIIQRINHYVFPFPEQIMENISGVTEFLKEQIAQRGGDPLRETLSVVKTVDGGNYFVDPIGNTWRCVTYIDNTTAHETVGNGAMLFEAGRAFGDFQSMLATYPAHTLHEIIPNFHNTPVRFAQLEQAIREDKAGLVSTAQEEIAFAYGKKDQYGFLMKKLEAGKLPLRVTHNDTKMSNVLLDDTTEKAVCVIDLDTVMPGLTAFDFGDSIRAGATTAAEDETDLSKVQFSMPLFEAYTKGFLSTAGQSLTQEELDTLPDGAILMTLEVGLRFLADYFNGDVYFRTAYPRHNLDRARNQFHLARKMEGHRQEMDQAIRRCANRFTQ